MSKKKVFCVICGKPPQEKTNCPHCGAENICKYHLYKFYPEEKNSPIGCPKCGPRCAVCNAQSPLYMYKNRAVCTSCRVALSSVEGFKNEKIKHFIIRIQTILTTILTLAGALAGLYLGSLAPYKKIIFTVTKVKMTSVLTIPIWGAIGLIIGSLIAVLLNTILGLIFKISDN